MAAHCICIGSCVFLDPQIHALLLDNLNCSSTTFYFQNCPMPVHFIKLFTIYLQYDEIVPNSNLQNYIGQLIKLPKIWKTVQPLYNHELTSFCTYIQPDRRSLPSYLFYKEGGP